MLSKNCTHPSIQPTNKQARMVKVEIISKESIKPSSPTPHHLKIFKLSLLDQLIPAPYAPIVLFYPNINGVQEKLVLLKKSLSQTLTRFYPLAGLIQDDLSINCNDQGAYFAVAEVNTHLSDFLGSPDIQLIHNKFLPCEPSSFINDESSSSKKGRVTNIQVNVFQCGGFAISLCVSHKILDGAALNTFLKSWAANANAVGYDDEIIFPDFMASSSLFPTDELWLRDSAMIMWGSLFKKGKCVTRRLVFDASAIATLKAEANSSNIVHQPTRVEVVSAFIWKRGMAAAAAAAAAASGKKNRPSILTHVVNLRKRTVPTLSDFSLGNIIWIASAKCREKYDQLGFEGLVDKVRKGISKINGDFVKKIRGDKGSKVMSRCLKEIGKFGCREGVDYYGFTSWCKFGFYEADFGWGKPVWVSSVGLNGAGVFMNLIILMDTKCGEGIEAWVTLDEQEMTILEHDLDLLAFASLDPSPMPN